MADRVGGQLAGKTAIITGGASGIGRATAELFVEEGAAVVIADIADAAGEALAESLGDRCCYKRCNVSLREDVEQLIATAVLTFGDLDIMFNNAGISCAPHVNFVDDPLDDFHKVMAVNLLGPMLGTQCAARRMAARGRGGVILNNASIAGILAGQAMMTRSKPCM